MHEHITAVMLSWLALQIPLGRFVGQFIKFGITESRLIRRGGLPNVRYRR
jgi:hypothetical protein